LRYQFGLRVAAHLGRDSAEKQRLHDLASLAYQMRSKIAHVELYTRQELDDYFGKELNKHRAPSVVNIRHDLVEVLRRALRSILVDIGEQRFKSNFHKALDRAVLTGANFRLEDMPN
jgi:hypothetical protein